MKVYLIFILGFTFQGFAQTLDRQVLSNYGGQGTEFEGFILLQNLGETVIHSGQNGNFVLHQGFEQPDSIYMKTPTGIHNLLLFKKVILYPNPGREILKVNMTSAEQLSLNLQIIDNMGRLLIEREAKISPEFSSEVEFDISNFANGIYYIYIRSKDGPVFYSSSWIKH